MKKILIIGSCAAGKSVLAKKIGGILNIPVYHLDLIHHSANWKAVSTDEFDKKLDGFLANKKWIIDGNYKRTLTKRADSADAIILLDYSRTICISRSLKRYLFGKLKIIKRDDVPNNCPEKIDLQFMRWIWNYPRHGRRLTLEKISESNFPLHKVLIFKTPKQTRNFLNELKCN